MRCSTLLLCAVAVAVGLTAQPSPAAADDGPVSHDLVWRTDLEHGLGLAKTEQKLVFVYVLDSN